MKKYVKPEVELVEFEVEEITNLGTGSGSGAGDIVIPGG